MARRWDGGGGIKKGDFGTFVFRAFKQSLSCGDYEGELVVGSTGERGELASENTSTDDEDGFRDVINHSF